MTQATIGRLGDALAVPLPGEIVEAAGLRDGARVEIEARAGTILIRLTDSGTSLEEMFSGRTAEEWRAAYAGAYDWGPDVGREDVPE